jgi:SsrA-binding protein
MAGMVLQGTEIKSIREGNVNLSDGFCFFKDNELFLRNVHIGVYKQGTHANHEPTRVRKLLLKKSELRKLRSKSQDQGMTIIPLKISISETGYAKLEIALAQGKKSFDKREDIKKRDVEREIARLR